MNDTLIDDVPLPVPVRYHGLRTRLRRVARSLSIAVGDIAAVLERLLALGQRANAEAGTTLPLQALDELIAFSGDPAAAGLDLKAAATPRDSAGLNDLLAALESRLILDELGLRVIGSLYLAVQTSYAVEASAIKALCAMLEGADRESQSAAQLAAGSLSALVTQGRRFVVGRKTGARAGAVAARTYRGAFELLIRAAKERSYGLGQRRTAPDRSSARLDLLQRRKVESSQAGWKLRSGVPELGDGLASVEAAILGRQLAADLSDPDPEIARMAAIAMAVYATQLRVFELRELTIGNPSGAPAWITTDLAQFRFDLSRLRTRPEQPADPSCFMATSPIAGSSLPRELWQTLLKVRECRPEAATLSELLDITPESGLQLLMYLRVRAPSSRAITVERLAQSRSRLAASMCGDESIAASLTVDFTLITPAVAHYMFLPAALRNAAASASYRAIGLSGDLAVPVAEDFSLNPQPTDEAAAQLLRANVEGFVNSIGRLPPNAKVQTLLDLFNQAAVHLGAVLQFVGALRPASRLLLGMRSLSIEDGWAVVSDKASSPYLERRIIALPQPLPRLLTLYCARLASLAARIEAEEPRLAESIRARLRSDSGSALIVRFVDGKIAHVRASDIAPHLAVNGLRLAPNVGRRLAERVVREAGLSSVQLAAQTGHAAEGQQPYARSSGLIVRDAIATYSGAWMRKSAALGMPKLMACIPATAWTPLRAVALVAPERSPRAEGHVEPCPFTAGLGHAWRTHELLVGALKEHPAKEPGALLVQCLAYADGVVELPELRAALQAVAEGIYVHAEPFTAFVDLRLARGELRRMRLSAETVAAAARLRAETLEPNRAVEEFGAHTAALLGIPDADPVLAVRNALAGLRVCHSLHVPRLMHTHAVLGCESRTAHPHLLLRQVGLRSSGPTAAPGPAGAPASSGYSSLVDEIDLVSDAFLRVLAGHWPRKQGCEPNELAFRLNLPLDELAELSLTYFDLLHDLFFVHRLADTTLGPYVSVIRPFMRWLAQAGDAPLEERSIRAECAIWRSTREDSSDSSNLDAMLNHLLRWVGEDATGTRRSALASRYVFAVGRNEVESAIERLKCLDSPPIEIAALARASLGSLTIAPLRTGEMAYLRFCDVRGGAAPFLVVSRASGALCKTFSGERLIPVRAADFDDVLHGYIGDREQTQGSDAYIFGDLSNAHDRKRQEQANHVALAALRRETGCQRVRLYDVRGAAITARLSERLIDPVAARLSSPLHLRNLGAIGAAECGHASPLGAFRMYFTRADELRRRHWDGLRDAHSVGVTPQLAAVLCDRVVDSVRRRYADTGARLLDLIRAKVVAAVGTGRLRTFEDIPGIDLATRPPRPSIDIKRPAVPPQELINVLVRRLRGAPAHIAAADTSVNARQLQEIDEGAAFWKSHLPAVNVAQIGALLQQPAFKGLLLNSAVAAAGHLFRDTEAHVLASTIALDDRPWVLKHPDQLAQLSILPHLSNCLEPHLLVQAGRNSEAVRVAARRHGIQSIKTRRHHEPSVFALLAFQSVRPRHSPASLIASTAAFVALVHHYVSRNYR